MRRFRYGRGGETYGEVEGDLRALLLDACEEARLLVGGKLVREGGRRHERGDAGQEAA